MLGGHYKTYCSQCRAFIEGSYNPAHNKYPQEIRYETCSRCRQQASAAREARSRPRETPRRSSNSESSALFENGFAFLGTVAVVLIGLYCAYLVIKSILPTLIVIVASISGLLGFIWAIRRFGFLGTMKVVVGVGVPTLLIYAYVANFGGDFEARASLTAFTEPDSSTSQCGSAEPGDNLDITSEGATRDTFEGRFVQLDIGGTPCWARLRDLNYQHGFWRTVFGIFETLPIAQEDDLRSRIGTLEKFDAEVNQARAAGNSKGLDEALARVRSENAQILPQTAAVLEAFAAESAFGRFMTQFDVLPDFARVALAREAAAYPVPQAKDEIARALDQWRRKRCDAFINASAANVADVTSRTRYLWAVAFACAAVVVEQVDAKLSELVSAVEADATKDPKETVRKLRALSDVRPDAEYILSAKKRAELARRKQLLEIAGARDLRVIPSEVIAARAELAADPELPPIDSRRLDALMRKAAADARKGAEDVLRLLDKTDANTENAATSQTHRFELALSLAPFEVNDSTLRTRLNHVPRKWRIKSLDVDPTFARAVVTVAWHGSKVETTFSVCRHESTGAWLTCPSLENP